VDVWVEAVGNTSYTLGSRIVDRGGDADIVYAKAVSVIVAVDGAMQVKRPLSQTERDALVRHVSAT
jgi:acyl-CoA thioester hydrolase